MAQESAVKSCLFWETDGPDIGVPRISSRFRMFGEEWFFLMSVSQYSPDYERIIVCLHRSNGENTLETPLKATCGVISNCRQLDRAEQRTVQISGACIFGGRVVPRRDPTCCENYRIWAVYCHLSSIEPITLQINNEWMLISNGPATDKNDQLQRLSEDFTRLLDEEIQPDATLECGGRTWRVHRSVLTVRSEVFAAMFRSGMAESRTGAVRIEDLEPSVLDLMLKYVYSGEVPDMSGEYVSGLYEAGDRYALHGLRKACSNWMVGNLSGENCFSFLVTADAHGDGELKETIALFIAEHYAEIGSEFWENFTKEHPFLAIAVLQHFAPSKNQ